MSLTLLIALVAVALVAAFVWLTYNRMVARRFAVDSSWSQIDVQLKRRHDLVPNLVEAVDAYATHERTTFERVSAARGAAIAAEQIVPRSGAEGELSRAVGRLLAVAEAYPELEASERFAELQRELAETESGIAIARRVYNDTVETYNTLIQIFPAVIVARLFGFERRDFFDAPSAAELAPEVVLTAGSTQS